VQNSIILSSAFIIHFFLTPLGALLIRFVA
jgi:hypothetical protein